MKSLRSHWLEDIWFKKKKKGRGEINSINYFFNFPSSWALVYLLNFRCNWPYSTFHMFFPTSFCPPVFYLLLPDINTSKTTLRTAIKPSLFNTGTPTSCVLDLQSSENTFTLLPNFNWSLLQNKKPSFSFTHTQDYWPLGLQSQQLQSHCLQMDFSNTK